MGLIADIQSDMEKGAVRLISEYRLRLVSDAQRLCGNASDVDDLVSRTLVKVISNIDSHDATCDFYAWMKSIMENIHRNDTRGPVVRGTKVVPPEELEQYAGSDCCTDEQVLKNSDCEMVRKALRNLPPEYKQTVILRFYEDLSLKEIASFLNKPVGTVSRRIHVALHLLAGKFSAEMDNAKKPLAVLFAALLGVGSLFGAWKAAETIWPEAFSSAPEEVVAAELPQEEGGAPAKQASGQAEQSDGQANEEPAADGLGQTQSLLKTNFTQKETQTTQTKTEKGQDMNLKTFKVVAASALGAVLGNVASAGALPPEYRAVEYVESTGSQGVNTKVVPSSTTRVVANLAFTETPTALACCGYSDKFVFGADASGWYANLGSTVRPDASFDLERHTFDVVSGSQKFDGIEFGTGAACSTGSADHPEWGQTLYLFGSRQVWLEKIQYPMKARIYSSQIYSGETLVRDFIPCYLIADETKVGFYDVVGDAFYTASGLIKGEDVCVAVVGDPKDYASAGSPSYGFIKKSVGDAVSLTAPETVEVSDGVRASCTGWKLSDIVTGELVNESTDANKTLCTFNYEKPVRLVWQWKVLYRAAPVVAGGLTVSPAEAWLEEGEEATFTVSGADYPAWTVNGVVQSDRSASITVRGARGLEVSVAAPRVIRVTQEGAGAKDGSDWGNACAGVDAAIALAGTEASTICLLTGDYALTRQVEIGEGANLVIRGGYTGVNEEVGANRSVLVRDDAVASMRILSIRNATVWMDGLVITNGTLKDVPTPVQGLGIRAEGSTLVLKDCIVAKNCQDQTSRSYYGGGLYISGGSLTVVDSEFNDNDISAQGWSGGTYGGAIYASGTAVSISGSTFAHNRTRANLTVVIRGGALWLSGGSAVITDCVFDKNMVLKENGYGASDDGYGGCIYASGLSTLSITDSLFTGNLNNSRLGDLDYGGRGGTLYLEGASMKAEIRRCVFLGNGTRTSGTVADSGSIYLQSGTLALENVLQAGCQYGNGVEVAGGTLTAKNCTFADISNGNAVRVVAVCTATFDGCVFDAAQGACRVDGGSFPIFSNCLASDVELAGLCNRQGDPLFADTTYFHLQSQAGRYDGGWFMGGSWVADEADSPAIDMGDTSAAVGDEPQPNGHRLNVGYDAATSVASKSHLGEPAVPTALATYIYPLADVGEDAVTVSGEFGLSANGSAAVTVFWGETDGGTDAANWTYNEVLGTVGDWTLVTRRLTGLAGRTYVRLMADDGESVAWSAAQLFSPVTKATLADVSVSYVTRKTLKAHGTLAADGGAPTSVRLRYWTDDGGEVVTVDYNLGQAIAVGTTFTIEVADLTPGVTYHYAIEAVNSAGVRGEVQEVTTVSTDPIVVYVTPEGAGAEDGTSWANAYSKLQDAFDMCFCEGDVIRLKAGTYEDFGPFDINTRSQAAIASAAGLTIRGGYTGEGDAVSGVSTLARKIEESPTLVNRRLLQVESSTVLFENLVFTNGMSTVGGDHGQAVKATSSHLTFRNCAFLGNGYSTTAGGSSSGGAIYANGGSLTAVDTLFDGNRLVRNNDNSNPYGGAIYATGAAVSISGCAFKDNWIASYSAAHNGGALCIEGAGSAVISNCTFLGNYTQRRDEFDTERKRGYGGTIYFAPSNASRLELTDCTIDGSYSRSNGGAGGVLYLSGSKQTTVLNRVKIVNTGILTQPLIQYDHGDIHLESGTLAMTNCLFANVSGTNAVRVAGGAFEAVNCTIADVTRGFGVNQTAGTATFKNSIVWNCAAGTTVGEVTFDHCETERDPLLYGPTKARAYHLRRGSPCADAGDASVWTAADTDLDGLPRIRNGKVDLGCYSFNAPGFMLMVK